MRAAWCRPPASRCLFVGMGRRWWCRRLVPSAGLTLPLREDGEALVVPPTTTSSSLTLSVSSVSSMNCRPSSTSPLLHTATAVGLDQGGLLCCTRCSSRSCSPAGDLCPHGAVCWRPAPDPTGSRTWRRAPSCTSSVGEEAHKAAVQEAVRRRRAGRHGGGNRIRGGAGRGGAEGVPSSARRAPWRRGLVSSASLAFSCTWQRKERQR